MALSVDFSLTNLVLFGILYYVAKKAWEIYQDVRMQELLEKWNNTPKGKVVLHAIPRGKTIPNISPFCLKLETYLRLANIPYEFEASAPFGPKGKSPWISYDGFHLGDTELIIQHLNKKFGVDLNSHLPSDQREICRAIRVMFENHYFFGLASWRWLESAGSLDQIFRAPKIFMLFFFLRTARVKSTLNAQGIGRHTVSDRTEMTAADLQTASRILGNKKFFGGDQPCEEDCSIFGMIGQAMWGAPGSPYERLLEETMPNLKDYCYRMKEKVFPDWVDLLDKSSSNY